MTSTKPYLIRAFYDWIIDNACTPYIVVNAFTPEVMIPFEYAETGQIVLNISVAAVNHLVLGNKAIEFQARFGGKVRKIYAPIQSILAIYAKENGRGMVFTEEDGGFEGEEQSSGSTGSAGATGASGAAGSDAAGATRVRGQGSNFAPSLALTSVKGEAITQDNKAQKNKEQKYQEQKNDVTDNKTGTGTGKTPTLKPVIVIDSGSLKKQENPEKKSTGKEGDDEGGGSGDGGGKGNGGGKGGKGKPSHLTVIK